MKKVQPNHRRMSVRVSYNIQVQRFLSEGYQTDPMIKRVQAKSIGPFLGLKLRPHHRPLPNETNTQVNTVGKLD